MGAASRADRGSTEASLESKLSLSANTHPLWGYDFAEVTGHNLESRGRKEVNRLLASGWHLLHIYTLRYQEDGIWRERPMAILGRLRNDHWVAPLTKRGDERRCSSIKPLRCSSRNVKTEVSEPTQPALT
jgi:hypothetical protein